MPKNVDHPGLQSKVGDYSEQKTAYPTVLDGSKPSYRRDQRMGAGIHGSPAFQGTVENTHPPFGKTKI